MGKAEFIVIDDDPINNIICQKLIELALPGSRVTTFTDVRPALSKLAESVASPSQKSILFLDINMPELNGWDFLDIFETYDETIRKNISIYLLSSSINQQDIDKAGENANVISFISKPLTKSVLQQISGTA